MPSLLIRGASGRSASARRSVRNGIVSLAAFGRGCSMLEVARAIFGADPVSSGEIRLFGEKLTGGPDVTSRKGVASSTEHPAAGKNTGPAASPGLLHARR